ncbi:trypsin-like serine protease [Sarocladium strictum]
MTYMRLSPSGIPADSVVAALTKTLTASVTKLPSADHQTLLKKRKWLQTHTIEPPPSLGRNANTTAKPIIDATLVFAQEEAGTAVCISPQGLLLTCSHCIAETAEELSWTKVHWLLFSSGKVVAAKTIVWDDRRDLALLQVVKASDLTSEAAFPYLRIAFPNTPMKRNTPLICIGHPGSEDLETSIPGVQTNYDSLVLSTGKYYGLAKGQDPQDNSEIGCLMHDCWTYWGHSGAPLVERKSGELVGVHSSWDDETAMRRGVPLEALRAFLDECQMLSPGFSLPERREA